MSDHDEVLARLDWCVEALKLLLSREVASEPTVEPSEAPERDVEPLPPPRLPPALTNAVCSHQHQTLIGRNICCAKCGHVLQANTGVYDRPVLMPE